MMKSPLTLVSQIVIFTLLALNASAQVVISEFMADNKKTITDANGQYSDWIEVYNTAATNVNLNGWALTDDPAHVSKWVFPNTNLVARGFLVVFATGTNRRFRARSCMRASS